MNINSEIESSVPKLLILDSASLTNSVVVEAFLESLCMDYNIVELLRIRLISKTKKFHFSNAKYILEEQVLEYLRVSQFPLFYYEKPTLLKGSEFKYQFPLPLNREELESYIGRFRAEIL